MIAVISPAKSLDFCPQELTRLKTRPDFLDDSEVLIRKLRTLSRPQLSRLMDISEKLADLNFQRYRDWSPKPKDGIVKQCLLAFKGDVYTGFDCENWVDADFDFAQNHLRILSGLYGVLKPLDLIQPYRLEMGSKLATRRGKDLYTFWDLKITHALNEAISNDGAGLLINLASNEYFSSVKPEKLDAEVVTPVFKDERNGQYKIISFFAKKARGMMANYIVRHRIEDVAGLKKFKTGGYRFDAKGSTDKGLLFLREEGVKE